MSAPVMPETSSLRTRNVAFHTLPKLELLRPLKLTSDTSFIGKHIIETGSFSQSSTEEVLQLVETVVEYIDNGDFNEVVLAGIIRMCNQLRTYGNQLEKKFKDRLDRYFVSFRNACHEKNLDMGCRLRLLEIIELRAMGWRFNGNLTNYYKRRIVECDQIADNAFPQSPTTPSLTPSFNLQNQTFCQPLAPTVAPVSTVSFLLPGEILKTSRKFAKPIKIPDKNCYKDEIIIRNSDPGKGNQGAEDRLVQITVPKEESFERSKQLIKETVRRNYSSPGRETPKELFGNSSCLSLNSNFSEEGISNVPLHLGNQKGYLLHSFSMNDASIGEYQYTVKVDKDTLKISSANLYIVQTAKLILDEFFSRNAERFKHAADNSKYGYFFEPVFTTNSQESLEDYSGCSKGNICDGVPASSNIKSYLEYIGCSQSKSDQIRHLSSSSLKRDNEEGTFKAKDRLSVSKSDSRMTKKKQRIVFPTDFSYSPVLFSPESVTVIREPLFPDSSKEAFQLVESAPNFYSLCAKVRRAKFAKTAEQLNNKRDFSSLPSPSISSLSAGMKLSFSSSPVVEYRGN